MYKPRATSATWFSFSLMSFDHGLLQRGEGPQLVFSDIYLYILERVSLKFCNYVVQHTTQTAIFSNIISCVTNHTLRSKN